MTGTFRAIPPRHWWPTAVVYEIYVRSFQDSNGDGIGDLPGLIERLDYLRGTPHSLGIDAIWLTPFYPSPLYDFGYDISSFVDIDPIYGTLTDFERLIAEAHRRDIKVIVDLVANHSSHRHPWFEESRSSCDNPKRDWYTWRDPTPKGGPPNNWESVFGGPAWTYDEPTGQYYLHSFLPQQPDLNWRNPEVREAMYDVVRFWIGKGVDGFRLDAISHIAKDIDLRDDPVPGQLKNTYSRNDPVIYEWLDGIRAAAEEDGTPRLLVSEAHSLTPEQVYLYHGTSDRPRMSSTFNFGLVHAPWSAHDFRAAVERFYESIPENVWPNVVLNNHDVPRSTSRYDEEGLGQARARVAALLEMTLPGAAYLYYGEEIGMWNAVIPVEHQRDVGSGPPGWEGGRDPARTPMQWSAEPGAGFTRGEPWLPIGPDLQCVNVETEADSATSLLTLYRSLIRLRADVAALRHGSYRSLADQDGTYCYLRELPDERILAALNFTNETLSPDLDESGSGTVLGGSHPDRKGEVALTSLTLRPNEGLVLRLT